MTAETTFHERDAKENHMHCITIRSGDTIPDKFATLRPFYVKRVDVGVLEVYWIINDNLGRVS